jgi:hypothetical protein
MENVMEKNEKITQQPCPAPAVILSYIQHGQSSPENPCVAHLKICESCRELVALIQNPTALASDSAIEKDWLEQRENIDQHMAHWLGLDLGSGIAHLDQVICKAYLQHRFTPPTMAFIQDHLAGNPSCISCNRLLLKTKDRLILAPGSEKIALFADNEDEALQFRCGYYKMQMFHFNNELWAKVEFDLNNPDKARAPQKIEVVFSGDPSCIREITLSNGKSKTFNLGVHHVSYEKVSIRPVEG